MPALATYLPSTGEARRALGRILLFFLFFIPLVILGSAALPASAEASARGLFASETVMLIAALLAGAVPLRRFDGRKPGALGIALTRDVPREIAQGFALGLGAIALATGLMAASGALRYVGAPGSAGAWASAALHGLGLLGVAAFAEEALFRGYPFQWCVRAVGPAVATLGGSVLFALAHGNNPGASPLALLNIFLAGVLLSAAYLRTRSLWFATALHLGWNWGMASLFDLPVSGLDMLDAPLYEPVMGGSTWLTGGTFGPEAGLAATLAFTVTLYAVWRWPALRESSGMRALRPLVDQPETGST
jgi:membrane protease YdiL (CAAX protease family)